MGEIVFTFPLFERRTLFGFRTEINMLIFNRIAIFMGLKDATGLISMSFRGVDCLSKSQVKVTIFQLFDFAVNALSTHLMWLDSQSLYFDLASLIVTVSQLCSSNQRVMITIFYPCNVMQEIK